MVMTEKMLADLLDAIERRVGKDIVKIVEEELRDRLAIGTLPPRDFPASLIHDGDYYDSESPAPKIDMEKLSKPVDPEDDWGEPFDGVL